MVRGILTNQLFNCAEANDTHGVGLIAGKLDDNLGSIARLTGEVGKLTFTQINNTMINNFANSPAYIKLVEVVLEQLSDLPERRAAIVDAIRNLNDDPPTRSSFSKRRSHRCRSSARRSKGRRPVSNKAVYDDFSDRLAYHWPSHARPEQLMPPDSDPWAVWLYLGAEVPGRPGQVPRRSAHGSRLADASGSD